MKKSILALVLASLALPAMSLSVDTQNRINDAMFTLKANGIDPTIMANNISDQLNIDYSWNDGGTICTGWNCTLVNAMKDELIVHKGNDNLNWKVRSTGVNYGPWLYESTLTVGSNISGSIGRNIGYSGYRFYEFGDKKVYSNTSVTQVEIEAEAYYDEIFANRGSDGIFKEEDEIAASLGNKIADKIVYNARNLKDGIRTMGYQLAAVDVGKNMSTTCVSPEGVVYSVGACGTLGQAFLDIRGKVAGETPASYNNSIDNILDISGALTDITGIPTGYGDNGDSAYVNYVRDFGNGPVQQTWVERSDIVEGWDYERKGQVYSRLYYIDGVANYVGTTTKSYLLSVGEEGTYFEDGSAYSFEDVDFNSL